MGEHAPDMLFDREGSPIDAIEWSRYIQDNNYRVVALTETDEAQVSTVWLGVNHNAFGGPPLIFETMVFGGIYNGRIQRYSTLHAARLGHAEMCKEVFG